MAQTKKKRRSKHRGNAAGTIESRGRTGRKPTPTERGGKAGGKVDAQQKREERMNREPTWRSATIRAALAAGFFFLAVTFGFGQPVAAAVSITLVTFVFYVFLGYYTDRFLWQRRMRKKTEQGKGQGKAGEKR